MSTSEEAEASLLCHDLVEGPVNYKGLPASRSRTGGWKSAAFIIGVEVAERFAFYGISSNLISYLTGSLGQSTAKAAANVNAWSGAASLLPLLGAFVADSFLGRYRTIIFASVLYTLALGLLTLSAALPFTSDCDNVDHAVCAPPQVQIVFFFFSLYLVAFAQGGHKPCVQAFGADQFDEHDPEERKGKSSFFNWWYFGLCAGPLVALSILSYIQDNLSWALGFGIPCMVMALALTIFLLGTTTYRFPTNTNEQNPLVRIGRVFFRAAKNRKTTSSAISVEEEMQGLLPHQGSQQFRFLNKALLSPDGMKEDGKVSTVAEVEAAKSVLRLVPVWVTCLAYAIIFAQSSTLFTKQGSTMDRSITANFAIPPAALQCFISVGVMVFIPFYDRVFVPIMRKVTGKPSGITLLQRIGTGLFLSILSMVIAATVEIIRLKTAAEHGLVDKPQVVVPMSVWWLIPQYVLFGISDVFTMVGLQEFFYDQVPTELRSIGLSLYLSIFGIGSYLSSFLISVIENITGANGQDSWFSDNLNKAHLDYFYWLLAGMSLFALGPYVYFGKSYIYRKGGAI